VSSTSPVGLCDGPHAPRVSYKGIYFEKHNQLPFRLTRMHLQLKVMVLLIQNQHYVILQIYVQIHPKLHILHIEFRKNSPILIFSWFAFRRKRYGAKILHEDEVSFILNDGSDVVAGDWR